MVTLPRYERRVQTPLETQSYNRDIPDMGEPFRLVAAATRLGQAGVGVYNAVDATLQERAKTDARAADVKLTEAGNDVFYNPDTGYFGLTGEAALNEREKALERLAEARKKAAEGLSPRALKVFDSIADAREVDWKRDVGAYAQKQEKVYADTTSIARQSSAANDYIRFLGVDDEKAEAAWGTVQSELVGRITRNITDDPEIIMQAVQEAKGDAYAKAATARLAEDPRKSLMLLDAGEKFIDPVTAAQLREKAKSEVYKRDAQDFADGKPTGDLPAVMTEASPALLAALEGKESNGVEGILGPVVKTAAGEEQATGLMQVLPSTGADVAKGLGIPWRPDLMRGKGKEAAAYQRQIGTAYFNQMLKESDGRVVIALAKYNAGPGVVEDWLNGTNKSGKNPSMRKIPDPRAGATDGAFIAAIPFGETKDYVQVITRKAGVSGGAPGLPAGELSQAQVYDWADKAAGDDPKKREAYRAAGIAEWRRRESEKTEREQDAFDAVQPYIQPGGLAKTWTDIPSAIWADLNPQQQTGIKSHYANVGRGTDPGVYADIYTLAATNPEAFKTADLTQLLPSLKSEDFQELVKLQFAARQGGGQWQTKQAQLVDVNRVAALVMPKGFKAGSDDEKAFSTAFFQAAQTKATVLGRAPTDAELLDIGKTLNEDVVRGRGFFGDKKKPLYSYGTGDAKADFAKIPEGPRKRIVQDYRARNNGRYPTYEQAVEAYRALTAAGVL